MRRAFLHAKGHVLVPNPHPPVLQALIMTPPGLIQAGGSLPAVLDQWRSTGGQLWLDVTAPDQALLEDLERDFHLDMQALAQILDPSHRAHVKEYEDYFFIQFPMPSLPEERETEPRFTFASQELDIFGGPGYLLTIHNQPQRTLRELWERYSQHPGPLLRGRFPDTLLYEIGDAVLSAFYPHLEWLEDQHDRLEGLIFAGRRSQIRRLVVFKRDLYAVRRAIAPLRDALASLARRDFVLLDPVHRYLFEELFARSVRLMEFVGNLHNLFDGLLHADLSLQNNRMNEVMKTLTVVATVMMPLTVLTGFFGMNFDHIPGLHSPVVFWGVVTFMVSLAAVLFTLFRRRGWW